MCFRQDGIVAVYFILRVLYADTLLCSFSHFSFGHWGLFPLGLPCPLRIPLMSATLSPPFILFLGARPYFLTLHDAPGSPCTFLARSWHQCRLQEALLPFVGEYLNQDVSGKRVHCYWGVIASRSPQLTEPANTSPYTAP